MESASLISSRYIYDLRFLGEKSILNTLTKAYINATNKLNKTLKAFLFFLVSQSESKNVVMSPSVMYMPCEQS